MSDILEDASTPLTCGRCGADRVERYDHIGTALHRFVGEGYGNSKTGRHKSPLYSSVKPFRKGTAESREVVYDDHQRQPLVTNYKQIMLQMSRK